MEVLDEIRTEHDRVAFLKSVAEQLLVKARVKLNLKNLYASNGFAGPRAAQDCDAAARRAPERVGGRGGRRRLPRGRHWPRPQVCRHQADPLSRGRHHKVRLVAPRAARQPQRGKDWAAKALGKNFDADSLKRQLNEMNSQVTEQTENLKQMLANLSSDESSMQQRIDKKAVGAGSPREALCLVKGGPAGVYGRVRALGGRALRALFDVCPGVA